MSAFGEVIARNFYLYPGAGAFGDQCSKICEEGGFSRCNDPSWSFFAIAPRLTRILKPNEWTAPELGTLVFHPSALPYRRGADAIRHTVAAGERVSAVTWFWCSERIDAGDICEQEIVLLKPGESAGRAYHTRFIPVGLRALARAIDGIAAGAPRRVGQDESLATYDPRLTSATSTGTTDPQR